MAEKRKKILIIRPGAIGDVVHTTIIPKSIKDKYPDYAIHYLTQVNIAPILEDNPYIDKIITIDRKQRKSFGYVASLIKELYDEHYDIIFNLSLSVRNILMSYLAFPKKIVARKRTGLSVVEEFFACAKSVLPELEISERLYLGVSEELDKKFSEMLSKYPSPHIVIVPAGVHDEIRQGRMWNIDYWKMLNRLLSEKYGGTVFVCGSKSERELHRRLASDNVVITSGEYKLKETNALLSKSDLVISGDTGPLHIASAHNVKTLALLGSTSPNKVKPYGENGHYISADTDCKYCWQKKCKHLKKGEKYTPCMQKITPESVMEYIENNGLI